MSSNRQLPTYSKDDSNRCCQEGTLILPDRQRFLSRISSSDKGSLSSTETYFNQEIVADVTGKFWEEIQKIHQEGLAFGCNSTSEGFPYCFNLQWHHAKPRLQLIDKAKVYTDVARKYMSWWRIPAIKKAESDLILSPAMGGGETA